MLCFWPISFEYSFISNVLSIDFLVTLVVVDRHNLKEQVEFCMLEHHRHAGIWQNWVRQLKQSIFFYIINYLGLFIFSFWLFSCNSWDPLSHGSSCSVCACVCVWSTQSQTHISRLYTCLWILNWTVVLSQ